MIQDSQRGFQALHNIDIQYRRLIHVRVFLNRTDQIGDTRRAAFDFIQQARDLKRSADPHQSCSGSVGIEGREQ